MTIDFDNSTEMLSKMLVDDLRALLQLPLAPEPSQIASLALERALALSASLSPQPVSAIDLDTFETLMRIAGPETAPGLLEQVLSDLHDVLEKVNAAVPVQDWVQLRLQSHILISVAGSLGANSVLNRAHDLNRLAHARDGQGLDALAVIVRDEIEALMRFVRSHAESIPG